MTDILAWIQTFIDSPSGVAIKALLVGTLLVFLLGIFAALRDGTFKLSYIDSFVRTTIWGRVAPVAVLLFVGYAADATGVITAAGITAAGAISLGLIGSAIDSIKQLALPKTESAVVNTLPGTP